MRQEEEEDRKEREAEKEKERIQSEMKRNKMKSKGTFRSIKSIFKGSLIREKIEDSLEFLVDSVFEPRFTGALI